MGRRGKKTIKNHYDTLGGSIYDIRYREEQASKHDYILMKIELRPDHILLDDGCGTGLFLEKTPSIGVGLDFSTSLINEALKRTRNNENIHLILGDAEMLPLKFLIFHKTVAITLFQNIPDNKVALKELFRVTRNNGIIIVTGLKKAFSLEQFLALFNQLNLSILSINSDSENRDWIAFLQKNEKTSTTFRIFLKD